MNLPDQLRKVYTRIQSQCYDGVRFKVGYIYANKRYMSVVYCPICAKDTELYKDGLFMGDSQYKRNKILPCGCGKSFKYNEDQCITLIKRELPAGITFVKFVDGFNKGTHSPVKLFCVEHGEFSCYLSDIRSRDTPCSKCSGTYKPTGDEYIQHVNSLYKTSGFTFKRSDRTDHRGFKTYLDYMCPICSNDEYVQHGLCSGVFQLAQTQVNGVTKSCRCSSRYSWKQSHIEYQIKKIIKDEGLKDSFVCFKTPYIKNTTKFIRLCSEHGEYETSIKNFKSRRDGCSLCYKARFNPQKSAYVYLVRWYGFGEEYLKFGITNREVLARVKEQHSKSDLDYEILSSYYFQDGAKAEHLENIIKQNFETSVCSPSFMRNGYTETTHISNYELISLLCEEFKDKHEQEKI